MLELAAIKQWLHYQLLYVVTFKWSGQWPAHSLTKNLLYVNASVHKRSRRPLSELQLSHMWLESSDITRRQFWDQTSCRWVEGCVHAQGAPWLLPAHIVSDECGEIFLRCLFDTSLTILRRVSVSTLLSAHVTWKSCCVWGRSRVRMRLSGCVCACVCGRIFLTLWGHTSVYTVTLRGLVRRNVNHLILGWRPGLQFGK